MNKVSRIITHIWPHLDEIVAIRLLKKHGNELYPGIRDARVDYVSTTPVVEGKTWEEHLAEGTILVGVGGGPFDEHPTFEAERKQGESACRLVAKALKIDGHTIYKRLIELVTEADLGGVHEFHIANRLKTRYRLNPNNPDKAIRLVNDMLDDWEQEQRLFVDARRELQLKQNNKQLETTTLPNGEMITIAVVEGDNFKVSAAARSLRIPVVIQKNSKGQVQIFCDKDKKPFTLKKIAAKIRLAECLASGMSEDDLAKLDQATLEREGKIPEAANWFYQVPGQNLLNGAESAPDTPPTKIPFNIIVEVVKKNIITE
jgi:hypothetical protein